MSQKVYVFSVIMLFALSSFCFALDYSQLDPKPYDPETEPDIDMFIGHWKDSMPRHIHGSLVVRDILTSCEGDPMKPSRKGAVLTELKSVSYAVLDVNASTTPSKPEGEQELYYIMSGKGVITSGKKTAELREGIGVVAAPGVEFTMTNTGNEPLIMYLIVEPIPEDFKPNSELVVKNEYDNSQAITVHWAHIDRGIIGRGDGTAVVGGLTAVKIDPMTTPQPHSHGKGVEEIWIALKGDINLLLGKQLRKLPVGSAYRIPSDGRTPHANINVTDKQIKLMHMMKSVRSETYDYSFLDPKQFDPEIDPNIDMFISSWKESMPVQTFGSLIERAIFTELEGDPMRPTTKGAVLTNFKGFSHASLEAKASTKPATLQDEQIILYIDGGKGIINAGGKTAGLYEGVGVLMPPGIEFTMTSTGDECLTMYVIREPIPDGFTPNKEMLVRDTNVEPISSANGHWCHIFTWLFSKEDGLATAVGMGPVLYDPMTMGQPHSHGEGIEEIWFALKGDITILLGKQLRKLPVGSTYKIPPNGLTPHSNINTTGEPIKLFWFMRIPD
ncbi:cupin domain-containing protein [Candidatus Latescibacterota bacterium]